MKVNIGPYKNWIGPYQIAQKILFWKDRDDDVVYKFGSWLANDRDGNDSYLMQFCQWIHDKKKRKVEIHIDDHDCWNLDYTLALIIVPCLKKLKEQKHGTPYTDDKDVPKALRSTSAPPLTKEQLDTGHTDANFEKRWEWIIDEMIFAFQAVLDDNLDIKFNRDKAIMDRCENGRRLFAKYYYSLWD